MTATTRTTRLKLRTIAAAAVVLSGAALALGAVPATAATPAHHAAKPTTVQTCGGRSVQRPTTLVGSCLTGDLVWRDLRWTGWTSAHPTAIGTQQQNATDTAKGPWTPEHVRLVLTQPRTAHGKRQFTQVLVERPTSHEVVNRYRLDSHGATFLD